MNKYKIIACDLDGTLLNNKSTISRENLAAIKKLLEMDVYFVPCTGRGFSELPKELKDNPDVRYAICSNGAVVYDRQVGNVVTNCIANSDMKEIMDILYSYDAHFTCRHGGKCYVDKAFHGEEFFEFYHICQPHIRVMCDYGVCLDNFKEFCYSADEVEAISTIFREVADKTECVKRLRKHEELRIVEIDDYAIEFFNVNAGKGNALKSLVDLLEVDISETIGMGDSENDISIVQAAGLGLAVANADDSLKKVADEVVCSNEEHAVEYVLKHYFL